MLALKMKLAEAIKTHNITAIVVAVVVLVSTVWATAHIAYWNGFTDGVERTEQCLDHWGKMKHDGWNFYCID
jgi:hypothetical protein